MMVKTADGVKRAVDAGFKHVRLNYGVSKVRSPALNRMPTDSVVDSTEYVREIPKIFEIVRVKCGDEVELMQHMGGQLPPIAMIGMTKRLEPFRPFFLEDPFCPEDVGI